MYFNVIHLLSVTYLLVYMYTFPFGLSYVLRHQTKNEHTKHINATTAFDVCKKMHLSRVESYEYRNTYTKTHV